MEFAARSSMAPPSPPEKGSFPLDHYGECYQEMNTYMNCMKQNKGDSIHCQDSAKTYLVCRMDKGLMAKEELSNMGYNENEKRVSKDHVRKESTGFIAGTRKRHDA
eukprot:TRINITY_DN2186_c0_g1_i3.p1 TRINITY_DN2186_c0_g1~~TRINITY_DN2186_c0_g1_i3.p1  ORF type:complete len:106 (+),score=22.40 TRINITY_DN2186_c0_g1_i3:174-491(+)